MKDKASRRRQKREIRLRNGVFRLARRFTPLLGVRVDGLTFVVHTDDLSVSRVLFVKQRRVEMTTLKRAIDALQEAGAGDVAGKVFVDVGANIGTTCIAAVHGYPFGSALALEPAPDNFRLLEINIAANGLSGVVHPLPMAISDYDGTIGLALNPTNWGDHRVVADPNASTEQDAARAIVDVDVRRLDSLVEERRLDPAQIGLLWIDAQGHEARILAGATRLLRAGVPVVLEFEPATLQESGAFAVLERLLGEHYTHVVDLRRPRDREATDDPPAFLRRLARSYERGFTDILALRAGVQSTSTSSSPRADTSS
jgi:FkbM family methyltransferase